LPDCVLCSETGGTLLWDSPLLRVIDACDPLYPGTTRVVLNRHAAEMTDLGEADQQRVMRATLCVERAMRDTLGPDKVNLAALGNMVAHLHWHVIPRWRDDPHFPQAIWAALPEAAPGALEAQRARRKATIAGLPRFHSALADALKRAMSGAVEG